MDFIKDKWPKQSEYYDCILQSMCFVNFYEDAICEATPNTVAFVRECIDQQLLGRVKKSFRENCVSKWNKTVQSGNRAGNKIKVNNSNILEDMCVIMDCILDENFKELDITIPITTFDYFSTLLSIISHRSPSLEKLKITFYHVIMIRIEQSENNPLPELMISEGADLNSNCLKSLTIENSGSKHFLLSKDGSNRSILSIIGKRCPNLKKLSLDEFCMRKNDVLGLIINKELASTLFLTNDDRWNKDSVLQGLRIPSEFLNPLCSTLQKLRLECLNDGRPCLCCAPESMYAFSLRHLPKLRVFTSEIPTCKVIRCLYNVIENQDEQAEFEEASSCVTAAPLFSGILFLDKIDFSDYVPIRDADTIRAVGSMCPHLDCVFFVGTEKDYDNQYLNPHLERKFEENGSPDEIESIFRSNWPKLGTIKLSNLKPIFVKSVLKIFGPANLKTLHFYDCSQLDLSLLSSYCNTGLEWLAFKRCSVNPEANDPALLSLSSETFLPMLKKFESLDFCLGAWAPYLTERKSTALTYLDIECCHFGTNAHRSRIEWSQMPELWPNLEYLNIRKCSGLTMTMVSNILPQMHKLRRINIPESIRDQDTALADHIEQYLSELDHPFRIWYNDSTLFVCPFQLIPN